MGTCRGFISTYLNKAKNNSQGAASYEWGPVKRRGILRLAKTFKIDLLLWYGALSSMITVSSRQSSFLCLIWVQVIGRKSPLSKN